MKIMQLVVYVSPRGVIIAKCDVAPIQKQFQYTNMYLFTCRFHIYQLLGINWECLKKNLFYLKTVTVH